MTPRPRLCHCRPTGGYCDPDCHAGKPENPELELAHGDAPPGMHVLEVNGTRYLQPNAGLPKEAWASTSTQALRHWRRRADYDPALDPNGKAWQEWCRECERGGRDPFDELKAA